MPLLEGKKVLITGVLAPSSIAFAAARVAQEEGAEILLTSYGRAMSLTQKTARRLPHHADVLELDVNDSTHIGRVEEELRGRWGQLDGFLHAIAYAPEDALGGTFVDTPWESAKTAFRTSAYSLQALAAGLLPILNEGASIVALDFDASRAYPTYDWMGVSKAALEAIARYLAMYLGPAAAIRVNCVSSGPVRTMAAKGVPGFDGLVEGWRRRSLLPWDTHDPDPVARTIAFLLSDWARGITGEILHVDAGFHAVGSDVVGPHSPQSTEEQS